MEILPRLAHANLILRRPTLLTYLACLYPQRARSRFESLNRRLEEAVEESKGTLKVPVGVFVTFEKEEGVARCLKVGRRTSHSST